MTVEQIEEICRQLLEQAGVDAPWFVVPAGAGALLLLLVLLGRSLNQRSKLNSELPAGKRTGAGRKALRAAHRAEKAGRKFDAATAYVTAGLIDKAVTLFCSEGKVTSAADALVSVGRVEDAADQYRLAGKWSEAGALYRQADLPRKAADCYDSGSFFVEAAELWEQAGELETAGDRYLTVGDFAKAARAFENAEQHEKFLSAFMPWWEAEMERQMGQLEPTAYWVPAVEKAASQAEQQNRWEEAFKLAGYLGRWHTAAQAAEALGKWEDAKRFYQTSSDLDGVARMAEKLGVSDEANIARGEAAMQDKEWAKAAEFFELGGRVEQALDLWMQAERWPEAARTAEALGRLEDAASAWAKAGEHRKVADLYFQLERWGPAGSAYEAAGELDLAADAYRTGKQWQDAARIAETTGKTQQAIQDLQQRLREVGQDRDVSLKLVELMMVEGMQGTALGILEPMVSLQPTTAVDADILYKYGMLLEDQQRIADAAKAYQHLLAYDVSYRDARARADRLKTLGGQSQSNPGATMGSPSTSGNTQGGGNTLSDIAFSPAVDAFSMEAPGAPAADSGGETQKILDRYVPQGELGRGGMGVVIKAHDKMLDRLVAIKIVKTPGVNTGQMDKILNEARATAKLNHPNIVQIYDCALAQGNFMMAMEYVEGQTIKDLIEEEGALPMTALVLIFGQIAKALQFAHDHGIVHRDIKPANVLWTADKHAKITDFGLARAAQELANTQTVVVGSPYYMAPEQLMGNLMDHRVDIYALGVSLYESATGELPFPKGDVGYHHVHTQAPDPRELRPDLPRELAFLILDMLAKDREERPADCNVVLQRLRELVQK